MAKVYALSTAPTYDPITSKGSGELGRFFAAAKADRFNEHSLIDCPRSADLVVFVDSRLPDMSDIRSHPVYKEFVQKSFVVHHGDRILPYLPGVYTCPEKWFSWGRTRTGCYMTVAEDTRFNEFKPLKTFKYLFSFVGRSSTARIRELIFQLDHEKAFLHNSDFADVLPRNNCAQGNEALDSYVSILQNSAFILCPRGLGTSSYRLFEALRLGRAPVIISDSWIPPSGPNWKDCAVFLREGDICRIPEVLEEHAPYAIDMGRAARATWDNWFAQDVIFHRTIDWCLQLSRQRRLSERMFRNSVHLMRLIRRLEFAQPRAW